MNGLLWHLAGPRLLLARVGDALTEGRSVVIVSGQSGFQRQVGVQFAGALLDLGIPTTILPGTNGMTPMDELLVATNTVTPKSRSVRDFCERNPRRVFVVNPDDSARGREWHAFLLEFQHSARQCAPSERATILLTREVSDGEGSQGSEVALSCFCWDEAITRPDVEALAQATIPGALTHGTLRRILARTVAEIALSDLALAVDLCGLSKAELAMPHGALLRLAAAGGWSMENLPPKIWIEGKRHPHPLAVALANDGRRQIWQLIWEAQAGILLPWVEHYRRRYLPAVARYLPANNRDGLPRDEFEVGTIAHFLRTFRPSDRHLLLFERLREVRNSMAHCEPLPYDRLHACIAFVEGFK